MRIKIKKKYTILGLLIILIITTALSFFYPCMPAGVFYNPVSDCLHDNNHSYFILTKYGIIYIFIFEEKEPKVLSVIKGKWHQRKDGKIKVDSLTNDRDDSFLDVYFEIQTYWWGMKLFVDEEIFYGFRLPEVSIYTIADIPRRAWQEDL